MAISKLKERIKLTIADPQWIRKKKELELYKGKKAILIGTPVHGNLGDHAIAEEEKKFLKKFFKEYKVFEILMPFYHVEKDWLAKHVFPQDIVFVSGGGWMGNLWLHNEIVIREIVNRYAANQIVIFPQTIFYTKDQNGERECQITSKQLEVHENLLLTVRDRESYNLAKNNYKFIGNSRVALFPDMVLQGYCKRPKRVESVPSDVIVCIRDDCESIFDGNKSVLLDMIPSIYNTRIMETVVPHRVKLKMRNAELQKSWGYFANAKLTITDRLHAMLFSVINGTPCIAINNRTGKVFGVFDWIKDSGMVVCAKSLEEVKDLLPDMLNMTYHEYDRMLEYYFVRLAEEIRKGIY